MVRAPSEPRRTFADVVRAHVEREDARLAAEDARNGMTLRLLVAEFHLGRRCAWVKPYVMTCDEWLEYWDLKGIYTDLADAISPYPLQIND